MAQGDPDAVKLRLAAARELRILPMTDDVLERVINLTHSLGLPKKALADIYHIAYCVVYQIDFLVTWNCTHIANPRVLRRLRDLANEETFFLPTIVTPDSLLED